MLVMFLASIVAACGAAAPAVTRHAPPDASTPVAASAATSGGDGSASTHPAAVAPWMAVSLADVRTGETFTIADLAGKVVVVEPMAIWCVNCLRQQREVAVALGALTGEDVAYISLDVDPSEQAADLAAYADEHGFAWTFVVADREVSRQLALALGDQVLSPPSTPKVLVTPAGQVVGPDFGISDSTAVEAVIRSHLS